MKAEPGPDALVSLAVVDQQRGDVAEALLQGRRINGGAAGVVQVDGSEVELAAPREGGKVEVVEGRALARRRHWQTEEDHRRRRRKEGRRRRRIGIGIGIGIEIGIAKKEKTTIGGGVEDGNG